MKLLLRLAGVLAITVLFALLAARAYAPLAAKPGRWLGDPSEVPPALVHH